MSPDGSRRFTDREVALVLRRASEIEETRATADTDAEAGLSLEDLRDIGRQVGISEAAIERAVSGLERPAGGGPLLSGAPAVRRAVRAVTGELNEEALGQLVRLVDEKTDSAGVVSEALGSVRWTSRERFTGMHVSLTPRNGETGIQVAEKALPRFKAILHLVPAAWGAMLTPAIVSGFDLSSAAIVAVLMGGVAAGGVAGRIVWNALSARSGAKVDRLATELSNEAERAVHAGMTTGTAAPESDAPDR